MDLLFRPEPIIWVQETIGLGHPLPFRIVSELSSSWGILLALSLSLWLFGRRTLYVLLMLVVVDWAAREMISVPLGVPRPDAPGIVKYEEITGSASFPSGHVMTAASVWGFLGGTTGFPLSLAILLPVAVAVGRMYLGVHYVADVLAALVLGGLLALGWSRVGEPLRARLGRRSFGLWIGVAALALGLAVAGPFVVQADRLMWNAVALVAGLALALPTEWRWIGYRPSPGAGGRVRTLLLGGLGFLAAFVAELAPWEHPPAVGAALLLAATLWALVVAPALAVRRGWAD